MHRGRRQPLQPRAIPDVHGRPASIRHGELHLHEARGCSGNDDDNDSCAGDDDDDAHASRSISTAASGSGTSGTSERIVQPAAVRLTALTAIPSLRPQGISAGQWRGQQIVYCCTGNGPDAAGRTTRAVQPPDAPSRPSSTPSAAAPTPPPPASRTGSRSSAQGCVVLCVLTES